MRLFVGLEPTPDFRAALSELQAKLRAAGVEGRYVSSLNLHMMLAFIGEWPENVSEALPDSIEQFPMTLSGLGVFTRAKVLWAGVQPSQELHHLSAEVRKQLDALNIPYDRQDFNPHITLVRKPVLPSAETLGSIHVDPATMIVKTVCLYQSLHEEDGMKYTVIGRSGNR